MTPKATSSLSINNTIISVTRHGGSGPEILLIHGIGSSGADFDPVIPGMTDFSRPIALDLRGHGQSGKPASGYHYQDYVTDVAAVIDELQLQQPIVLGHSLGGIITLAWSSLHPDAARAIIIEDSPLRSGEGFREAFEGWLTLNALPQEQVRTWYASKNPDWSDAVLDQRAVDMTNTQRAAIEELMALSMAGSGVDTTVDLQAITVPTLFLHGDAETGSMVHPDDLLTLPGRMPNVELVRFAGAGHTIHRSQPEAWLSVVRDFIDRLEG